MNLGVVVTDAAYADAAVELIEASAKRGWATRCFLTDSGVRLLENSQFRQMIQNGTAQVAVCELSIERYGQDNPSLKEPPEDVVVGGQYQDAELVRMCDRVMVF